MFSSPVAQARAALLSMTLVWGSTFVANQSALQSASPSVLICLRFSLAALGLALWKPSVLRDLGPLLLRTVPLGLSTTAGFFLQIGGLRETTPARSAFITALFVLVVPVFEAARLRRLPEPRMLLGVALAVLGVGALFSPGTGAWTRGDSMTLLSTFAFAFFVVEVDRLGKVLDAHAMTFGQFVVAAVATAPFIPFESPRIELSLGFLALLSYLAFVCSTLAIFVAAKYQHRVSPTEAAVIYTLEPIIATAFSIVLAREAFSWHFVVGGMLVIGATLLVSLRGQAPAIERTAA